MFSILRHVFLFLFLKIKIIFNIIVNKQPLNCLSIFPLFPPKYLTIFWGFLSCNFEGINRVVVVWQSLCIEGTPFQGQVEEQKKKESNMVVCVYIHMKMSFQDHIYGWAIGSCPMLYCHFSSDHISHESSKIKYKNLSQEKTKRDQKLCVVEPKRMRPLIIPLTS